MLGHDRKHYGVDIPGDVWRRTPQPPVPLPVYPFSTVGVCRTCGSLVTITEPVFPTKTNKMAGAHA